MFYRTSAGGTPAEGADDKMCDDASGNDYHVNELVTDALAVLNMHDPPPQYLEISSNIRLNLDS